MKKNNLSRLALLGMASGLIAAGQSGIEAVQDENSIDLQYLIARPKCGSHGCGGLTAERDVPQADQDDELDDLDSDETPDTQKMPNPNGKNPNGTKPNSPNVSKGIPQNSV